MRELEDYILLYLKGVCMGVADIVPGVSGGTIAFITGIYDELLHAIKSIDVEAFRLLTQKKFRTFWKKINGNFLCVMLLGILTSFVLLARLVMYLLLHHPVIVLSFFFGLILISVPLVLREIRKWDFTAVLAIALGISMTYGFSLLSPIESTNALWFVFFSGMLAVCAMFLPGISGALVLVLLGKYQYLAKALLEFNISAILVFLLGCVVGLVGISRILSWILDNYHTTTVALLAGFMLGSLNKVWPWREAFEFVTNSKGEQVPVFDKSILPWEYFATTGKNPLIFQAILMMALGVFIVVLIEKIASRLKTKI